jgi:hypothetical protein
MALIVAVPLCTACAEMGMVDPPKTPAAPGAQQPPPPPPAEPPPTGRQQRRPDGLVYNVQAGLGVGGTRVGARTNVATGFAADAGLVVGLSGWDWIIGGLRVDAGTVNSDSLGSLGLHLAVFPGANGTGPVRDFAFFADAAVGGALASPAGTKSSAVGLGRIGVYWERWTLATVAIGPYLAGQISRGSNESQSTAVLGVSMRFSNERAKR